MINFKEEKEFKINPIRIGYDEEVLTPSIITQVIDDIDNAGNQQDRCYIMNTILEEDESASQDDERPPNNADAFIDNHFTNLASQQEQICQVTDDYDESED